MTEPRTPSRPVERPMSAPIPNSPESTQTILGDWLMNSSDWKPPSKIFVWLLIFLAGFSIPISTTLSDILFPILLIIFFFEWKTLPIRQHLVGSEIWLPALLFTWLALSLTWTIAPIMEALIYLKKYRILLFFAFLTPLLYTPDRQTAAWTGFLAACALTLVILVAALWAPEAVTALTRALNIHNPVYEKGALFKNYITTGIFMAVASFFWLILFRHGRHPTRWLWLLLGIIAAYMDVFHSNGRTGYILTFLLVGLFLFQTYKWKSLAITAILVPVIAIMAYKFSADFQKRTDTTVSQVLKFNENHLISTGLRISYFKDSLPMIMERPITGQGIGSTKTYFRQHYSEKYQNWLTSNPHNEYILQVSQGGLFALGLFFAMLIQHFRAKIPSVQAREFHHGVILAIAVGSLANSLFLDHSESYLYTLLVSNGLAAAEHTNRPSFANMSTASDA